MSSVRRTGGVCLLIPCSHGPSLLPVLQVDAGFSGCLNPDSTLQLQRSVLLLLCYRLLWPLVTDLPSERPCLSQDTGRTESMHTQSFPLSAQTVMWLCHHVQVQNGLAVYTTWTSIASLINFSVVLHLWGVDRSTAGTASLCILFAEVVGWYVVFYHHVGHSFWKKCFLMIAWCSCAGSFLRTGCWTAGCVTSWQSIRWWS